MKTTLGGDRLGSGGKQEVSMRNYERSTHDLSYIWRSSMSSGTLVPFMSEVGLPGDSFDIDLSCDVKTLPTVGPLFGSYKVQLDVFQCPVRLYQGKLHMNMLNIGMDMSAVKLPQLKLRGDYDQDSPLGDNQQLNSSSIFSYLNIRGLGRKATTAQEGEIERKFNAIPYLSYWDIYKQYYSNKQEERGFMVHSQGDDNRFSVTQVQINVIDGSSTSNYNILGSSQSIVLPKNAQVQLVVTSTWQATGFTPYGDPDYTLVMYDINGAATTVIGSLGWTGNQYTSQTGTTFTTVFNNYNGPTNVTSTFEWTTMTLNNVLPAGLNEPTLFEFPLDNIDEMRMNLLEHVKQSSAYLIDESSISPYGTPLGRAGQGQYPDGEFFKLASQEGLGIKTYQSDLFNNWISTEWIDGQNGINEISAVSTAGGQFTIDSLNLAYKVYQMLNRIALSGGSYDDWLDATYTHERSKGHENPIYCGSLIKELAFEEVISHADITDQQQQQQPLGTLAGRGRLTGKHKGGKIKIKCDEVSQIIAIASITPRIDYSQGNRWDVNLETMNDYHKPQMDQIGFQNLISDGMHWEDTKINQSGDVLYSTVGKQPAWINYMTNVNQCRGSFAEKDNSMFMTLNRRYETSENGIEDITTYVDPSKYNNIFATTSLDSQNFWVQIGIKNIARRKMSAKVIPNL